MKINIWMHVCMLSCFSHVWLLQPHGLLPSRRLCPWDSPDKNPGVGWHALLERSFPTQGLDPCPLHFLQWHAGSLGIVQPRNSKDWDMQHESISHDILCCNRVPEQKTTTAKQINEVIGIHIQEKTHMQSTSWDTLGWRKHSWSQDCREKYQ